MQFIHNILCCFDKCSPALHKCFHQINQFWPFRKSRIVILSNVKSVAYKNRIPNKVCSLAAFGFELLVHKLKVVSIKSVLPCMPAASSSLDSIAALSLSFLLSFFFLVSPDNTPWSLQHKMPQLLYMSPVISFNLSEQVKDVLFY